MNTTRWIDKYYAVCNGRMVVHTGDIIQNTGEYCNVNDDSGSKFTNDIQWEIANQSMGVLLKADIPYTWNAGDHDGCLVPSGDLYANSTDDGWIGWDYAAFNPSVVQKASLSWSNATWVGSTDQGMDTAVTFSGANQNFLLINIQFNGIAELAWAQRLLSNPIYKGYHVIIATHGFIDDLGQSSDPNLTEFSSNLTLLLKNNPDVFLTLNGHYTLGSDCDQAYHTITSTGVDELMFNRQEDDNRNGAATVTILTFDLRSGRIYVNTFYIGDNNSTVLTAPIVTSLACAGFTSSAYSYQYSVSVHWVVVLQERAKINSLLHGFDCDFHSMIAQGLEIC